MLDASRRERGAYGSDTSITYRYPNQSARSTERSSLLFFLFFFSRTYSSGQSRMQESIGEKRREASARAIVHFVLNSQTFFFSPEMTKVSRKEKKKRN